MFCNRLLFVVIGRDSHVQPFQGLLVFEVFGKSFIHVYILKLNETGFPLFEKMRLTCGKSRLQRIRVQRGHPGGNLLVPLVEHQVLAVGMIQVVAVVAEE